MEFRAQYLRAMREKAPAMFRELSASGELMSFAEAQTKEAHRVYQQILASSEKDSHGQPTLRARREAEEQVMALFVEFPSEESSIGNSDREELDALLGTRPLTPPRL